MAIGGYHATLAAIIVTTEKLPSFVLYLESHVNKQSTLIACPLAFIRIGIDAKTQSDLVRGRVQLRRFEHKELFGQLRRHAGYHETESERALLINNRACGQRYRYNNRAVSSQILYAPSRNQKTRVLCRAAPCRTVLCCAVLCCTVLCHALVPVATAAKDSAVLCRAVPYRARLCCAMLGCAVPCCGARRNNC